MTHDSIAVVDFGGQYAHLIATKIRRLHVLAEIRQPEDDIELFKKYKGIILSGSPSLSAFGQDSDYNKKIFDLDIPILGFCFGHQEIAKHYGGKVVHGGREWGPVRLRVIKEHPLFEGTPEVQQVFMSHFDSVIEVGPDFEELAITELGEERHRFAAIASDAIKRFGFQFHPEVDDTVFGEKMLENFVKNICGCKPTWTMEGLLSEMIEKVQVQVGSSSVLLLASGGVDSTVVAKVLGMAIGPERLHLLHVDNGLMRKGESETVINLFGRLGLDKNLHFIEATNEFLSALDGIVDPELKRKAVGDTFIEVFEREANRLGLGDCLLAQGTIYPDRIETGGSKRADLIKTHHNRVPIIERMIAEGRVVEPIADLYKAEVRELGERLGIPREFLWRHPFPGPGLAIRVVCSTGDINDIDDEKTARDIAKRYGLKATVLPIKSVGVKADLRVYEHPVLVHGECEWERLLEAAGNIFKSASGVNRCLLNLGSSFPKKIKPVRATVTKERLDLLREADFIVMEGLKKHGIYDLVWQCPTVLLPLIIDEKGNEVVVIRPVLSERAMTATPARLPEQFLEEIRYKILRLEGVCGLFLDVSTKPPATIEWE